MKRIRKKLDLTQKGFVGLLGCSKKTVERWEKEPASGPVVLLMKLLERNMDYIKELEIPSQNLPVRMWYMYKEKYCTLIDVERNKEPDSDKKLYGQCNVPGVWKKGTSGYG